MNPVFFLLITLQTFLSQSAFAADVFSFDACVDLVRKNNADLQAAEANLQSVEYQESASYSNFLPQVSANLGYTRGNQTTNTDFSTTNNVGSFSTSNTRNYSATLSGSWNLFAGLQDAGKVQQAKANSDAQRSALQISKAQVSYDLKSAYQGFLYAKESTKLTKEIIKRREENLRLVELRFESGLENKGSVLLSQANREQAKYDDIQAENARRVAMAQLARALGLDEFTELDVQGEIPIKEEDTSRPNLKDLAIRTPNISQAEAQEESAYQSVRISRSQFMPALNLTGSVGRQDTEFFPDRTSSWTVGLNLSFPLFNGGKDYFGLKSSAASYTAASKSQENTRRQVLASLEQTYSKYVEGVAKLKVDASFRDATGVRAEIARKRYNNGLITFDDWNIIEDDLISRQKVYLQTKRDRVLSEAAYEQAQGKGIIP